MGGLGIGMCGREEEAPSRVNERKETPGSCQWPTPRHLNEAILDLLAEGNLTSAHRQNLQRSSSDTTRMLVESLSFEVGSHEYRDLDILIQYLSCLSFFLGFCI